MNDQRGDDVPPERLKKGKSKKGNRRPATEGLAEDPDGSPAARPEALKKGDRHRAEQGLGENLDVPLGASPLFQEGEQGDAAVDPDVAAAIRAAKESLREVRGFVLK